MKKTLLILAFLAVLGGAVFSAGPEDHAEPIKTTAILQLDMGNKVTNNELQKMFTALTESYLKNNSSYILACEVYRERNQQDSCSSLALTELDYGSFTIMNIRYTFSNGYFEFKLSRSPFTNIVNNEAVNSIDYNGQTGRELYMPINNKLQEAVYVSRGYAKMHDKTSSASFYLFRW
ncbi:MAG: hypothetical protein LBD37_09630 [Treponema sp.]|jgi:hypothetical protein|nr:hypothetical protein [Treponema sp.]